MAPSSPSFKSSRTTTFTAAISPSCSSLSSNNSSSLNTNTSNFPCTIHFFIFFFVFRHETESRLRVHITDAEKKRWEVPYNLLPREKPPPLKQTIGRSRKDGYAFEQAEYAGTELIFAYVADPFSFSVKRKSNGETLFDSSRDASDPYSGLVFKDQYLEISTKLPREAALYGLGENSQPHGIKLHPNDPYTLYTTDISAINLNADLYGSHPVYMDLRNVDGEANAHAVLLLNSNGMDVFYRGNSLTYKVIGGVFDFYFFSGPSPLAVVDQYTAFVGRPAAMPYWAFGEFSFIFNCKYCVCFNSVCFVLL